MTEHKRSRSVPAYVGLCPDLVHMQEFYVPLDENEVKEGKVPHCPDCDKPLMVYGRR